jgi:signal transduction histidine kinase
MVRFFPRHIGIHIRVLSAAVLLICATTLILGYLGVNLINQFVFQRFNQRIDFMAQYLAINSELGILIDEHKLLQGLADNLLREDDIAGVDISARNGRILATAARELPGPFARVEKKVFLAETASGSTWFRDQPGMLEGRHIGQVAVTYSTRGIAELLAQMKHRFVYMAVALTLLACGVFYFISRSLVAPVIRLADTARKVSMGNRTIRAAPGTTPEIARLAEAFNEMLDSLAAGRKTIVQAYEKMARQEALAEVGKFSMMIAHEVKNPLGIIKSSLEILKSDLNIPGENIPLQYAEEEIVRLNTLIESFLMFSKPAKLRFEPADLNRMLAQVVMKFEIQYAAADLTLDSRIPDTPFQSAADVDLLSRGIGNMIQNACEANGSKGTVTLQVTAHKNRWQLHICDQGPGIPPEDRQRIFEPFYTTRATGTGLGLAFADQVIKAHGGTIRVDTPSQGGTRFCVTLFSDTREHTTEHTIDDLQFKG